MMAAVLFEFSGRVRAALRARGVSAWSYDLLDAEDGSPFHIKGDIQRVVYSTWREYDLVIAHPPCTHLAVSGARWFKHKAKEQAEALDMIRFVMDLPVQKIALENPISIISSKIRKPDQIVQPFMFGDPFRKTTCLWLKNLPKLVPTSNLTTGEQKCWKEPPHPDRWKRRSRTYPGFANAMAEQWGKS